MAKLSALFSTSLPVSVMEMLSSSLPLSVCALASGASFTGVTVRLKVAVFEVTSPSLTVKVNESLPLKSAFGVYVRLGAVPLSEPCAGVPTLQVSASPSRSSAVSVTLIAVSSSVVTFAGCATGASFSSLMTIETVAAFDVVCPSLTVKVNESLPLKSVFGV